MSRKTRNQHKSDARDDLGGHISERLSTLADIVGTLRHLVEVKDSGKRPNANSWQAAREALSALDN